MSKRKEARVQRPLQVRVMGMDVNGRPILATARTLNISRHGVVVAGLASRVNPGEVISLQYKGRKVRYRVIWAGDPLSGTGGQLGLQTVNLEDDLWQEDLPKIESFNDIRPRGRQRRQKSRYEIRIPVELRSDTKGPIWADIGDMSASGCYVKTLFPMVPGTSVTVTIRLGDDHLTAKGIVRNSLKGVGCGVEFHGLLPKDQLALMAFCRTHGIPARERRATTGNAAKPELELDSDSSLELSRSE